VRQQDRRDQRRLAVLPRDRQVGRVRPVRVVVDLEDELALERLELDRLADVVAFGRRQYRSMNATTFSPRVSFFAIC
jgi:hypothetical protein